MLLLEDQLKIINSIEKNLEIEIKSAGGVKDWEPHYKIKDDNIYVLKISMDNMDRQKRYDMEKRPLKKIKKKEIRILPNEISELNNLEELHLSYAFLGDLPQSMEKLENLKEITINSRVLENLPNTFGNLPKLESLRLFCESLKNLPDSMQNLKTLKKLLLYDCNSFKEVPETLSGCSNLEDVMFRGVPIREIPSFMGKLPNLKKFSLIKVDIDKIPQVIAEMKVLENFCFRENPLKDKKDQELMREARELGSNELFEIFGDGLKYLKDKLSKK
ncbi:MAG: leucine-rich repeat domain-containing protein [Promethearchaeota archaeon]